LGLPHDRGQGEVDAGQYDNSTNVFSSCLACTLIKRKVFRDVGLLDERMFFYFEDVDFGFRARISGWQVVYCPRSVVYHLRGGSTGGKLKDEVWFRARPYLLRIMLKNYQLSGLLQYGSRRVLLDLLRVAAGIKNRDRAYSQNYAFEIWWNLLHPPIKERISVQQRRKVPDRLIMKSH
jgi:GT2 family glycosyltransferase